MKKFKLCLNLFLFMLCFVQCVEVFGLLVKGPILIIGAGDEERSTLTSNYKVQEIYKVWDVKIANDKIYVLEFGSSELFTFDLKGNLIGKAGGLGAGKNELYLPHNIESIGPNIWIADVGNTRIQVFEDQCYKKTIKMPQMTNVDSIAVSGQNILVAPSSLLLRKIAVLDKMGNYKYSFPYVPRGIPKKAMHFFYSGKLMTMPNNRVFIGFPYYPIVATIESDLKTIKEYDMSKYYSVHFDSRGISMPPAGYSAMSFSTGPKNSILIAACDKEERKCSRVLQFSQDFKKIGEWDPGFTVCSMSYYPAKNLLAAVNGNGEVLIYEVH